MMCYRDMTFCRARGCINTDCTRHIDNVPEDTDGLPIALAGFEADCPIIIREAEE